MKQSLDALYKVKMQNVKIYVTIYKMQRKVAARNNSETIR